MMRSSKFIFYRARCAFFVVANSYSIQRTQHVFEDDLLYRINEYKYRATCMCTL